AAATKAEELIARIDELSIKIRRSTTKENLANPLRGFEQIAQATGLSADQVAMTVILVLATMFEITSVALFGAANERTRTPASAAVPIGHQADKEEAPKTTSGGPSGGAPKGTRRKTKNGHQRARVAAKPAANVTPLRLQKPAVSARNAAYTGCSDPTAFWDACIAPSTRTRQMGASDLYAAYTAWCIERRCRAGLAEYIRQAANG
ncbi:MAG: hypothetical protein ACR2PI_01805, partial [Hyphomicrobiaceae bacterium]